MSEKMEEGEQTQKRKEKVMNLVKVAKLGTAVKEVALESTANVADALRAAEVEAGGFEIRLNGNPVDDAAAVRSGDVITLVPQIKGGNC